MVEEASEDLDCFASFENDLKEIVKNQYFGLACKLRGEGKLLTSWFDIVRDAINYGKVAVVNYGKYLLRAQVVEGFKTQTGWSKLKFLYFGDQKSEEFTPREGTYVIFCWRDGDPFNLSRFKHDILEMWNTRELIGWDQDKSKKRITVEFERDPGKEGWKKPMQSYHDGYIGVISPGKGTNQIKKWEYFNPQGGNVERQQLWKDYEKVESRFFLKLGIRHNPFSKEERQNNPEVTSGQSHFDAWEAIAQESLVQGILEFQEKPWGGGKYTFQFGSLPTLLIENKTTQLLVQQPFQQLQQSNQAFLSDEKEQEHKNITNN